MNKVIALGRLTKDMTISQSNDLKIAKGALALDRGKDKDGNDRGADFPNIVAFGKRAEFFERFGQKGRRFLIEGHLQTGNYEKDGVKHYTTDIIVDRVEFADSKATSEEPTPAPASDGFMNVPEDMCEELPFA